MPLQVYFDCVEEPFLCSSFYCDKRLGKPIEYGVTLVFNYANSDRIDEIANLLKEEKNSFSLSFNGQMILNLVELSGCEFVDHPGEVRLLIRHIQNKFQAYDPGPYKLRNRVLKAANLLDFFNKYFSHLVSMDDTVGYALKKISFFDKEKNNLIQFQQTDYELLIQVINWYNCIVKPQDALILSGSATDDRYQLAWIQEEKCIALQYPNERKLDDLISSSFKAKIKIGRDDVTTPHVYRTNTLVSNISYLINRGDFDLDEWNKWKNVQVPAFYNGKYAYHIKDNFEDRKDNTLVWESDITTIARKQLQDIAPIKNTVWCGIGSVTNRSATKFWIEVELPDFETGANRADVRVTTLYSGHAGNAGLHIVPEKGTEVQILKASDPLSPIVLLHNVRSQDVIEKAPFWKLEDNAKWDFQRLEKKVKDIQITSDESIVWKTKGVTTKIDSSKMEIS